MGGYLATCARGSGRRPQAATTATSLSRPTALAALTLLALPACARVTSGPAAAPPVLAAPDARYRLRPERAPLTEAMHLPWRGALGDGDGDGRDDLFVALGGDWYPQHVVGFAAAAPGEGLYQRTPRWVSDDLAFNGPLRLADVLEGPEPELVVASTRAPLPAYVVRSPPPGVRAYPLPPSPSGAAGPVRIQSRPLLCNLLVHDLQLADLGGPSSPEPDGRLDLLVVGSGDPRAAGCQAPGEPAPQPMAALYLAGGGATPYGAPAWSASFAEAPSRAELFDVDQDGWLDAIIAVPASRAGKEPAGRTFTFFGGPGGLPPLGADAVPACEQAPPRAGAVRCTPSHSFITLALDAALVPTRGRALLEGKLTRPPAQAPVAARFETVVAEAQTQDPSHTATDSRARAVVHHLGGDDRSWEVLAIERPQPDVFSLRFLMAPGPERTLAVATGTAPATPGSVYLVGEPWDGGHPRPTALPDAYAIALELLATRGTAAARPADPLGESGEGGVARFERALPAGPYLTLPGPVATAALSLARRRGVETTPIPRCAPPPAGRGDTGGTARASCWFPGPRRDTVGLRRGPELTAGDALVAEYPLYAPDDLVLINGVFGVGLRFLSPTAKTNP